MECGNKRKWREAATRYLTEQAISKDSGADDVYQLKLLDQFLGDRGRAGRRTSFRLGALRTGNLGKHSTAGIALYD